MIVLIASVDNNLGIGHKNDLLFKDKRDLIFFKMITSGEVIVMGKKTFISLPNKPLVGRFNVVLSSNKITGLPQIPIKEIDFYNKISINCVTIDSISEDDIKYLAESKTKYFIIGGESLYKTFLPYTETIYLTHINKSFENVDKFFPNINDFTIENVVDYWESIEHSCFLKIIKYTKN